MQDKLKDGSLTTERTEACLNEHLVEPVNVIKVHSSAMLSLIAKATPLHKDTLPETLTMDLHRLVDLHYEFNRVVDGCTVIVTVQHLEPTKVQVYVYFVYYSVLHLF